MTNEISWVLEKIWNHFEIFGLLPLCANIKRVKFPFLAPWQWWTSFHLERWVEQPFDQDWTWFMCSPCHMWLWVDQVKIRSYSRIRLNLSQKNIDKTFPVLFFFFGMNERSWLKSFPFSWKRIMGITQNSGNVDLFIFFIIYKWCFEWSKDHKSTCQTWRYVYHLDSISNNQVTHTYF